MRIWLIGLLCWPMAIVGAQTLNSKQSGTITGQIVNSEGGPVAGAVVMAMAFDSKSFEPLRTFSDEKGSFKFDHLERSTYRINVVMPGYVVNQAWGPKSIIRVGDNIHDQFDQRRRNYRTGDGYEGRVNGWRNGIGEIALRS
jgi:hypothetical protein